MNAEYKDTTEQAEELVREVPFYNFLIDYITRKLLYRTVRKNALKGYPKLFVLPDDFIGQHIISTGLYEEHLLRALFDTIFINHLAEFSEATALDIGANIGNHSCFFSKYFDSVIAFEPNNTVFEILRANIAINDIKNVVAKNFGLSDREAQLSFIENMDGNLGMSRFGTASPIMEGRLKSLPVKKGDRIIEKEFGDKGIKLIKIDVEGHELAVLKGLKETINKQHPIILFEANTSEDIDNGQEIFDFLKGLGYCFFYSVEPKKPETKSKLMSYFERIVKGSHIYIRRILVPCDRAYTLIIAAHSEIV